MLDNKREWRRGSKETFPKLKMNSSSVSSISATVSVREVENNRKMGSRHITA